LEGYAFDPVAHADRLVPLLRELAALGDLDPSRVDRVLRRYPLPTPGGGFFSRSQLLEGARRLAAGEVAPADLTALMERLTKKPVRSLSGVAVVTVFTRPFPCPGRCVFCPNDVSMPKSYLAAEPGCQRAGALGFDPYSQTRERLRALANNGHPVSKVELIVLGGTWSFYPEGYQRWFVERCLSALNRFRLSGPAPVRPPLARGQAPLAAGTYNERVVASLGAQGLEEAGWEELLEAQRSNETASCRCVGLSIETRPDRVDSSEVRRLRRLGVTRVQLGYQSFDDEILRRNHRDHQVTDSRRATGLLRRAGFKVQGHWMANLLGATPEGDVADFRRLFADPALRPDELKLYPCSLVEGTELMERYGAGEWRPYRQDELLEVVCRGMAATPPYCRLSRVIRDIPGGDIVTGNKVTNFREVVEAELRHRGWPLRDIRAREVRGQAVRPESVRIEPLVYDTDRTREVFLQALTPGDLLAGFLRLSLPRDREVAVEVVRDSALLRELHVYGPQRPVGEESRGKAQHGGLGRRLTVEAARLAREAGFRDLAVISSVGTRAYYRRLGFGDGELYQHLAIAAGGVGKARSC
jgi:elongator complex protein 3